MSETGAISGRYTSIEDLAQLVDAAILAVNAGRHRDKVVEELGNLLVDAGSKKPSTLRALRLANLLQSYFLSHIHTVAALGESLVRNHTDLSVKQGLNEIAAILERERAQAADRLRHRP